MSRKITKTLSLKVYKLTAIFEKLIYTEAGKNVATKDIDQVQKVFNIKYNSVQKIVSFSCSYDGE